MENTTLSSLSNEDLKRLYASAVHSHREKLLIDHNIDTKYAFHIVRLLNQAEQILTEHDLDLERNREQLKSIRRGEWTKEQIQNYFNDKEKQLEKVYLESKLRYKPAIKEIKALLLQCLEQYFGSLDKMIRVDKSCEMLINDISEVLNKYK